MGNNKEKSNIAIAILKKLPFLKGNKNYFSILMAAIIFSPTVLRSELKWGLSEVFLQNWYLSHFMKL